MFYVLSDPHGCYDEFLAALSHWDSENEILVVLGDLIDRGPDSLKIVQTLYDLKSVHPDRVIIIKGNHDEMFVEWLLDIPEEDLGFYYMNGHDETILSFYHHNKEKYKRDSRKQRGKHIRYNFMKELRFLYDLPMYHETEHIIFVHAGIDLSLDNWRDETREMNWIRNKFIYASKPAPKKTFFGHTPTALIRDEKDNHDIWISPTDKNKVGIDGGVVFGGQLNALKIDTYGTITKKIAIQKDTVTA